MDFYGTYDEVHFQGGEFTELQENALFGIQTDQFFITSCPNLTLIQSGFAAGTEEKIFKLEIDGNQNLKSFPFGYLQNFSRLFKLSLVGSKISEIPGNIIWPSTLSFINMDSMTSLRVHPNKHHKNCLKFCNFISKKSKKCI